MSEAFETDLQNTLGVLQKGGVILYPTDTIWGLGCDATNSSAIKKIYNLKERPASKSLILLLANAHDLLHYVAAPDPYVFDYINTLQRPTTLIFENAINLPENLIAENGSIGIRIVQDAFCKHLIKRFRKPIVSTSANKSGDPAPQIFSEITDAIKKGVDYCVRWRQDDSTRAQPSQIVKWNKNGTVTVIRA
ncbi:MAG TPA: L-threonylcarbamoyladenylate synthase [Chitinophagaceae bacterium]|nr:L-threonylcarbamoyladenylate synthase [Chitinophagaceae bacterium]